ncbi:hypothetical protein TSAR_009544 [Trichomalopsis sarcophagae]|uniref:Uncharacterized protein n=1 Tax=Trichomalopsis sarcophagae TaxID=543379 RepID=A0A232F330_9HYME|nr:hypothetical protein TSAR_009544 [Trichomalopsis sarcophagae]
MGVDKNNLLCDILHWLNAIRDFFLFKTKIKDMIHGKFHSTSVCHKTQLAEIRAYLYHLSRNECDQKYIVQRFSLQIDFISKTIIFCSNSIKPAVFLKYFINYNMYF